MKNIILILILFFSTTIFAQKADDIVGKYHLPNGLDVKIYKVKNGYNGKIIALNNYKKGQKTDYKNPDKSKRKDLLINKEIIKGLLFNTTQKQWLNAKMYGPEKGMTVNLKVTHLNNNKLTVIGSKYFFRKTLVWTKFE